MKSITLLIFIIITVSVWAQTESLKLSSDVWPPFTNVDPEKSIALDIVEEALNNIDISVDYQIIGFDDVMIGISSGMYDGSAALWLDESRKRQLLFSEPYLQNQLILVGRKDSNVDVSSVSELKQKRIGVVKYYSYGDEIYKGKNNRIIPGDSDQQNLERLISEEIDYFLVDALLIQYLLKYQLNDVSTLLEIGDKPLIVKSLHLGINKTIPDASQIIKAFNKNIKTMMADGTYNKILELNWVTADVNNDGQLELILAGNEAGTLAPSSSYNIMYSEETKTDGGFYIDGKLYKSWDEVPNKYKVEIPKTTVPSDLENATMKIKF
jgi:ABC-type amino acid transport substrate-binding protein